MSAKLLEYLRDKVTWFVLSICLFATLATYYHNKTLQEQLAQTSIRLHQCVDKVCVQHNKVIECIGLNGVYLTDVFVQQSILGQDRPYIIFVKLRKRCKAWR